MELAPSPMGSLDRVGFQATVDFMNGLISDGLFTGDAVTSGDSLITEKTEMLEELHETLKDLKSILEKISAIGETKSTGTLKIEQLQQYGNEKSKGDTGKQLESYTHS